MTRKGKLNKNGGQCKSIEDKKNLEIKKSDQAEKPNSNLEERQTKDMRQKQSQSLSNIEPCSEILDENGKGKVLDQNAYCSLVEDYSQLQICSTNNNLDQNPENKILDENLNQNDQNFVTPNKNSTDWTVVNRRSRDKGDERKQNLTKRSKSNQRCTLKRFEFGINDSYKNYYVNSRKNIKTPPKMQSRNANMKSNHLNNNNDGYGSSMGVGKSTKQEEIWKLQNHNSYKYSDQVLSQYQEPWIPWEENRLNPGFNPIVMPVHVFDDHVNKRRRIPPPVNNSNQGFPKRARGNRNQKDYIYQQVIPVTNNNINREDGSGTSDNVESVIREKRLTPEDLADGNRYENIIHRSPSGKHFITLKNRAAPDALVQYHVGYLTILGRVRKWLNNIAHDSSSNKG